MPLRSSVQRNIFALAVFAAIRAGTEASTAARNANIASLLSVYNKASVAECDAASGTVCGIKKGDGEISLGCLNLSEETTCDVENLGASPFFEDVVLSDHDEPLANEGELVPLLACNACYAYNEGDGGSIPGAHRGSGAFCVTAGSGDTAICVTDNTDCTTVVDECYVPATSSTLPPESTSSASSSSSQTTAGGGRRRLESSITAAPFTEFEIFAAYNSQLHSTCKAARGTVCSITPNNKSALLGCLKLQENETCLSAATTLKTFFVDNTAIENESNTSLATEPQLIQMLNCAGCYAYNEGDGGSISGAHPNSGAFCVANAIRTEIDGVCSTTKNCENGHQDSSCYNADGSTPTPTTDPDSSTSADSTSTTGRSINFVGGLSTLLSVVALSAGSLLALAA